MTPKVSVIVPIYNQAPFIQETVDSVLSQDYEAVELLLNRVQILVRAVDRVAPFHRVMIPRDPRVSLLQSKILQW